MIGPLRASPDWVLFRYNRNPISLMASSTGGYGSWTADLASRIGTIGSGGICGCATCMFSQSWPRKARAAAHLGITQPAVSKVIADLEYTLKIRLLDRGRRGVEPTVYGRALLRRGTAAFDELKQSVMDIAFLSDPASGELRIGCSEAIADANLPPILLDFSRRYPRVALSVIEVP